MVELANGGAVLSLCLLVGYGRCAAAQCSATKGDKQREKNSPAKQINQPNSIEINGMINGIY